ncbi:hypothetical protein M413DRAFT_449062 [Hebeloma cylindrosporum]|uniref:protein-tyrosine-phosphatase n=1 Tax=Hebeloma cylindrosporum TaxID=76867 RepID=A0A0C2XEY9_HEBCY|nr:hypothetical protein M413DRAFT_449062 [Hebeloma cylindrosporum h7]
MDASTLRSHNITHIIQVLDVPWNPLSDKDGFNLYKIEIMDEKTVDIRPYLEGASSHIERALRAGRNVLVHCQQGVSRSASIVIAYLIRYHNMSYESASSLVRHKRACVKPNSGFVHALHEWEGAWKGVGSGVGGRPGIARRFTS